MTGHMRSPHEAFEWADDPKPAFTPTQDTPPPARDSEWDHEDDGDDFEGYADDFVGGEDILETEAPQGGSSAVGLSRVARHDIARGLNLKRRPEPWRSGIYGLIVHATGRGTIWKKGLDEDGNPLRRLQAYYNQENGPSFINGWAGVDGGELVQMADERMQNARGVGMGDQVQSEVGGWDRDLPATVVQKWRARWPGYHKPTALLPLRPGSRHWVHPNICYLQVECIPCSTERGAPAAPMRKGLLFTTAQHDAIAALAVDIADRHGWPRDERWWRTPRLLGHEDLTPFTRSRLSGKNGSIKKLAFTYDPGALKADPWFDWDYVYQRIEDLWRRRGQTGWLPIILGRAADAVAGAGKVVTSIIENGQILLAVQRAIARGERNENELADIAFYAAHPERNGRRIALNERALINEWKQLRERVVRPLLRASSEVQHQADFDMESDWVGDDEAEFEGVYEAGVEPGEEFSPAGVDGVADDLLPETSAL